MNLKKTIIPFILLSSMPGLFAVADPDFERTNPGELPLWSGSQWVKTSTSQFSAKIIEDAAKAASGKQFLRVENPGKGSVYVIGNPSVKRIPGHGILIRAKARGNGLANVTITPFDTKRKSVPWSGKHEAGFKKMDPANWYQFELRYTPINDEDTFQIGVSVRDGQVDYDDFKIEFFELPQSEQKAEKPAPVQKQEVKKVAAKVKTVKTTKNPKYMFLDFEQWKDGKPAGWTTDAEDAKTILRPVILGKEDADDFGSYCLFLDGKTYMDPLMTGLGDRRKRPIRVSFFAKGENGHIKANLREGRWGGIDYLIDLVDENTTSDWKKYAVELVTPGGLVENIGIEFRGKNVMIDNVELEAIQGNTGKMDLAIPIVSKAPVIDGVNSPGEWDFASGASDPFRQSVDGSALGKSPALQQQGAVKLCSDGKKLYMLVESPNIRTLKADSVKRDDAVYSDDCIEVHFNPEFGNTSPLTSYQFIFNGKNVVFDQKRIKGTQNTDDFSKWNAKSLVSNTVVKNGVWTLEMSLDLDEVEITPDKEFGFNLCYTRWNPTEGGTMNGYGYLDLKNMIRTVVSKNQPAMYWSRNGDWGSILVTVSNDQAPAGEYKLNYRIDSEKVKESQERTIFLSPGKCVPVLFNVKDGAGKFGTFELDLRDSSGKLISNQVMDFNTGFSLQKTPERSVEFHLLPEQKKYAVNVHLDSGKFADLDTVTVTGATDDMISYKVTDFQNFNNVLVVKAPWEPVDGEDYQICVQALNKKGEILATVNKHFKADYSLIPPETPELYQEILPPHKPIVMDGNTAKVNLRDYIFAGNGLPEQIIADGEKALNAPISLVAVDANGKKLTGKNGTFKVISAKPEKMIFSGETIFPGFKVILTGEMEYDGAIFYRAEIDTPAPVKIQKLTMETPFRDLSLFHAFMDSQLWLWMCRQPAENEYRHPSVEVWTPETILFPQGYRRFTLLFFPNGDGQLFSSKKIVPGVIKNGFMPYLTFGNFKYGMEIFADCDRGWVHTKGSSVQEIYRRNGQEVVCTNFIASPFELNGKRNFEFGILATPAQKVSRNVRFGKTNIVGYSHQGLTDQSLSGLRVKDYGLFADMYKRWKNHGVEPLYLCCKGHYPQMDPVAQYMDSEWRTWPLYTFRDDIQSLPTRIFGTDPRYYESPSACYTPGRLNFYGERFNEIIKNTPDMAGVYWDENWLKPCNCPNHAECGYLLPDGQVQGRAWWRGVREVDRRVRHIFRNNGRENPILHMFTGEGVIPHAYAFGSFNSYAEHPTYDLDFIDYWTPHFTEIGAAGAWGFNTGFFGMFRDPKYLPNKPMHRALLALVKLYCTQFHCWDFNWEFYKKVAAAETRFNVFSDDVEFVGYFSDKGKKLNKGFPATVKASFYIRPGKGALLFLSNLGEKPFSQPVSFDLKEFGINSYTAEDAEEMKPIDLNQISIPRHDYLMIELKAK